MAELINTFTWSISAAQDFDDCPRKRYWGKYASWGGWKENATPIQRKAYQLSKMQNRYSLLGNAVEHTIRYALRKFQDGETLSVDQLYEAIAKPYLNGAWKQSKDGLWKDNPKRYICLREHYYSSDEFSGSSQNLWVQAIIEQCKKCIANFQSTVLERLKDVRPEHELAIAHVGDGGDPESFEIEGLKIYAIPDYVYRTSGGRLHIHDWKAGKAKPQHHKQMRIYALWALGKGHIADITNIGLILEYLSANRHEDVSVSEADLDEIRSYIRESVEGMADFLVDNDIRRNEALPQSEWVLTATPSLCKYCNFYELCEKELKENPF